MEGPDRKRQLMNRHMHHRRAAGHLHRRRAHVRRRARHVARILPIDSDHFRFAVDHIDDRETLEFLQRDLEQAVLDVAARIEQLDAEDATEPSSEG